MSKNKKQNDYGNFIKRSGKTQKFVARLTVLLLILGGAYAIYHKFFDKKSSSVAATAVTSSIPGWWFQQYFGTSVCTKDICKPDADPDQDKLTNSQELYYHTNPLVAFTIKDKLNDGQLVALGFDPSRAGRMTFDQVASDDTIIGDSLVFNSDIKQIINQSVDLTKINLPVVRDDELKLSQDYSQQAAATYLAGVKEILNKHLANAGTKIENALKYQDDAVISTMENNIIQTVGELKATTVPPDFVQLHKYTIGFLQLLPNIFHEPAPEVLLDDNNPIGNEWYEKVQATFSLYQKITLETSRLQTKYQDAK